MTAVAANLVDRILQFVNGPPKAKPLAEAVYLNKPKADHEIHVQLVHLVVGQAGAAGVHVPGDIAAEQEFGLGDAVIQEGRVHAGALPLLHGQQYARSTATQVQHPGGRTDGEQLLR